MDRNGGWNIRPDFNFLKEEETEDDPFKEEERRKWQKEEKEVKEAYFKEIEEEEGRGYFRKTTLELIQEKSQAKKLGTKKEKEK